MIGFIPSLETIMWDKSRCLLAHLFFWRISPKISTIPLVSDEELQKIYAES